MCAGLEERNRRAGREISARSDRDRHERPIGGVVKELATVAAPHGKCSTIRGHWPFAPGIGKPRDIHVLPPGLVRGVRHPFPGGRDSRLMLMEWRLKKRCGLSIASHRDQPHVGGGLGVDSDVGDVIAITRPALRKALNRRVEYPLILAGRANPLQEQVRRSVPCGREYEAVTLWRPDRRRLVECAGCQSGRSATRRIEEPDSRCLIESIDRRLPPIEREGDVHICRRRPQRPGSGPVTLKPRRLCDGPVTCPMHEAYRPLRRRRWR